MVEAVQGFLQHEKVGLTFISYEGIGQDFRRMKLLFVICYRSNSWPTGA